MRTLASGPHIGPPKSAHSGSACSAGSQGCPSHPPELKQSSAGAGGISEFLNPSILLPLRDSLVPHTDMSAFFRESENGWSCHFNTVGMNKSWI